MEFEYSEILAETFHDSWTALVDKGCQVGATFQRIVIPTKKPVNRMLSV